MQVLKMFRIKDDLYTIEFFINNKNESSRLLKLLKLTLSTLNRCKKNKEKVFKKDIQ